jgi:hypothetical protein
LFAERVAEELLLAVVLLAVVLLAVVLLAVVLLAVVLLAVVLLAVVLCGLRGFSSRASRLKAWKTITAKIARKSREVRKEILIFNPVLSITYG